MFGICDCDSFDVAWDPPEYIKRGWLRRKRAIAAFKWDIQINGPKLDARTQVMALPYLQQRKMNAVMFSKQAPDGSLSTPSPEEPSEENHGLLSAAEDLNRAVKADDIKGIAAALEAAFMICDSYEDQGEEQE